MACALCFSGLQASSQIIQLYHKSAITHKEHYSLSLVSENEYHVEDHAQIENSCGLLRLEVPISS